MKSLYKLTSAPEADFHEGHVPKFDKDTSEIKLEYNLSNAML